MIWAAGRVVAERELAISPADRTFEHGLGLFEAFRTWNRDPVLLPRHLARLQRSADALGLALDAAALPTAADVDELLRAQGLAHDARLRLTLTGGVAAAGGSALWLSAGPLPPPPGAGGAAAAGFWTVLDDDPLTRHKTLNSWRRRLAFEQAQNLGADELLARTPDGLVWEGSRTNLFVIHQGQLQTPPLRGPILPGVMRGLVLERARAAGIAAVEQPLDLPRLVEADEVFLTNSVRGVVPVGRLCEATRPARAGAGRDQHPPSLRTWPAPGPITARVAAEVLSWLERGGPGE